MTRRSSAGSRKRSPAAPPPVHGNDGGRGDTRYGSRFRHIWRGEPDVPGELVYSRNGLPEPRHTVEIGLDDRRLARIPRPGYYRFTTPPQ